ncbi:Maf family protein [Luteimonas sp. JM171]|uniref:Maf family protein n=1 Tax=Luteimonas sp. JM171 TaxID=1896164 RepID=UPI0008585DD2|nr:Maf family nucleotide pyrophosphatase [Luteimonas sp. JM171]AOH36580.1 septum formation protein Maf [Luteimonas sp. JM171]
MARLLLASTSPYRRELLQRLRLPFDSASPGVDETPLAGERPVELVQRLARDKAAAVAAGAAGAWVIGSDQVAELDGVALGKPGAREAALSQLEAMSGREVRFHTAVALLRHDGTGHAALDLTTVRFRRLERAEIERYVDAELPFDCAGSFKAEGLGIALFDAIESQDPTALVGLPLIATARLLRQAGFPAP